MTTDPRADHVEQTLGVTGQPHDAPDSIAPDLRHIAPDLRLLAVPLASLVFDPDNARKHGAANMRAIVYSLRTYGQQKPIVIDADNRIVAGNGTAAAAQSLGWTHIAASRTTLRGNAAVQFALADNRAGELAEWEAAVIGRVIGELPIEFRAEMALTDADLAKLMPSAQSFDVPVGALPAIQDGDRKPFRQVTFTLHESQVAVVMAAIEKAKSSGASEHAENKNTNGNALWHVCRLYNGADE